MFTGLKYVDQVSPNQNLDDENLRGMNFKGTNFKGSSFRNADLTSAVLFGCNLDHCDFTGAILDGANLAFASVEGAIFEGCSLNGTFLFDLEKIKGTVVFAPQESELGGCVINNSEGNVVFSVPDSLESLRYEEDPYLVSQYVDLTLSLAGVENVYLSVTNSEKISGNLVQYLIDANNVNPKTVWAYSKVDFSLIEMVGGDDWTDACLADLTLVRNEKGSDGSFLFEAKNFTGADLSNFKLEEYYPKFYIGHHPFYLTFADSMLKNCNLQGADFSNAYLAGTNFDGSDLSGADFCGIRRNMDSSVNLMGASLVDVIMNEETNIFLQRCTTVVNERTRVYVKGTPKRLRFLTEDRYYDQGLSMSPSLIKEVFPDFFGVKRGSRWSLQNEPALSLYHFASKEERRKLTSYFFKTYTNLDFEWVEQ